MLPSEPGSLLLSTPSFFFLLMPRPPRSTLFPYTTLFRSYQFAGLLRGARTEIVKCMTHALQVPASAEIVLEGFIRPDAQDPTGFETAAEGPFGDHTGYYNEVERSPVLTLQRLTIRRHPSRH